MQVKRLPPFLGRTISYAALGWASLLAPRGIWHRRSADPDKAWAQLPCPAKYSIVSYVAAGPTASLGASRPELSAMMNML